MRSITDVSYEHVGKYVPGAEGKVPNKFVKTLIKFVVTIKGPCLTQVDSTHNFFASFSCSVSGASFHCPRLLAGLLERRFFFWKAQMPEFEKRLERRSLLIYMRANSASLLPDGSQSCTVLNPPWTQR